MTRLQRKIMVFCTGLFLTLLSIILIWGYALGFILSFIPIEYEYAWLVKSGCLVIVGYFGGIGIPVLLLWTTVFFTMWQN